MQNPLAVSKLKNTPLQTMRILFSRLLIYIMYVVCWRARACSGEWLGKELHTLLVTSAIYVNLGTYRLGIICTKCAVNAVYIRRQTNGNDGKPTRGDFICTHT